MSIQLRNLTGGPKGFGLGPVSLTLETGKLTALIGPNGCGKSTLLNLIAGVLPTTGGDVSLGGTRTAKLRRKEIATRLTLLPQNPVIPPAISVAQLVHYGRAPHQNMFGMRCQNDTEIVERALHVANIADLRDRTLAELSGGQRQRAFIAMGLAQDTPYILLDEPTSFLDIRYQIEILTLLRTLTQAGQTCVVVLHDIGQAARYADQLVVMKAGQIIDQGPPECVVSRAMLKDVYGLAAQIIMDPVSGTPIVTPD